MVPRVDNSWELTTESLISKQAAQSYRRREVLIQKLPVCQLITRLNILDSPFLLNLT